MASEALAAGLLGAGTAVMWGVSDFLAAKASRSIGPIVAALAVNAIASATYIAVFVVFIDTARVFTLGAVVFAALGGVMVLVGALLFFEALQMGPVSIVSPVSSAYPLITTISAIVLLHASLSWREIVGILMVVIGLTAATGVVGDGSGRRGTATGPLLAVGVAFAWGAGYSALGYASSSIGWQLATLVQLTSTLVVVAALVPFAKRQASAATVGLRELLSNRVILAAGIVQLGGTIALNIGLEKGAGDGAIATTISATYPLLTIVLAMLFFREKLTPVSLVGALLAVSGAVILSS